MVLFVKVVEIYILDFDFLKVQVVVFTIKKSRHVTFLPQNSCSHLFQQVASQKEYNLQSGNSQILDSDYLRFAGNWASSAFSTASFV